MKNHNTKKISGRYFADKNLAKIAMKDIAREEQSTVYLYHQQYGPQGKNSEYSIRFPFEANIDHPNVIAVFTPHNLQ